MGNILYGDLGSERMVYSAIPKMETVIQALYTSCDTLTAGYCYWNDYGIWNYCYKYNARHAGYLTANCLPIDGYSVSAWDSMTFSTKEEFEAEHYEGSYQLETNEQYSLSNNNVLAIIGQLFQNATSGKPVYLLVSKDASSVSDYMLHGIQLCRTIITALPPCVQMYFNYLSNTIPAKRSVVPVHLMVLPTNYDLLYTNNWNRSFSGTIIDCSVENIPPKRVTPYMTYLARVITAEETINPEIDSFFSCIKSRHFKQGRIDLKLFDTLFSLYFYSRDDCFSEKEICAAWRQINDKKSNFDISKLREMLNDKTRELVDTIDMQCAEQKQKERVAKLRRQEEQRLHVAQEIESQAKKESDEIIMQPAKESAKQEIKGISEQQVQKEQDRQERLSVEQQTKEETKLPEVDSVSHLPLNSNAPIIPPVPHGLLECSVDLNPPEIPNAEINFSNNEYEEMLQFHPFTQLETINTLNAWIYALESFFRSYFESLTITDETAVKDFFPFNEVSADSSQPGKEQFIIVISADIPFLKYAYNSKDSQKRNVLIYNDEDQIDLFRKTTLAQYIAIQRYTDFLKKMIRHQGYEYIVLDYPGNPLKVSILQAYGISLLALDYYCNLKESNEEKEMRLRTAWNMRNNQQAATKYVQLTNLVENRKAEFELRILLFFFALLLIDYHFPQPPVILKDRKSRHRKNIQKDTIAMIGKWNVILYLTKMKDYCFFDRNDLEIGKQLYSCFEISQYLSWEELE